MIPSYYNSTSMTRVFRNFVVYSDDFNGNRDTKSDSGVTRFIYNTITDEELYTNNNLFANSFAHFIKNDKEIESSLNYLFSIDNKNTTKTNNTHTNDSNNSTYIGNSDSYSYYFKIKPETFDIGVNSKKEYLGKTELFTTLHIFPLIITDIAGSVVVRNKLITSIISYYYITILYSF